MKKILFPLVALVCSMSMNAKVMKIMKNGEDTPVQTYKGSDYYVVFEEATTGTAQRTGGIDVNWVQLWENGPKFAEYNVGATSATQCGGYYCWGNSHEQSSYWTGETGTDDIASTLWGSNWRMPTADELGKTDENGIFVDGLLGNCDVEWIDGSTKKYNNTTVPGLLCTGKDDYASNSVFLPAAGYCDDCGVGEQDTNGYYWSSSPSPYGSDYAGDLYFDSDGQGVDDLIRYFGCAVRAVLAE